MGGLPDKIGRVAFLPYGVTRTAVEGGMKLGKAYFGSDDTPGAPRQVTKQQYDAAISSWQAQNKDASAEDFQKFRDSMSMLPPPAPDLADETVQRARQAARRRLLMGGLTGPIDLSGASVAKPPPGLTGV